MDQTLSEKYDGLLAYLRSLGRVAVAFSSGVDSTFLLYAAKEALGANALALTASGPIFPKREQEEAETFCAQIGVRQKVLQYDPLSVAGFADNPKNRCYICKRALLGMITRAAAQEQIQYVVEGSNLDDEGDYRPGLVAVQELGILSPLRTCGFTKQEIRIISHELGLPTWDKSSFACLSSRIPYGEEITEDKLAMIERAEALLLAEHFRQFRVRVHGQLARIELLPEDMDRMLDADLRQRIDQTFHEIGFAYVTLDLTGYRTGSLNETLTAEEKNYRQKVWE